MTVIRWMALTLAAIVVMDAGVTAATATSGDPALNTRTCCPIVELRQYTLFPGTRDTLIALFEDQFIESQEKLGMSLPGLFRDQNNPNRFVWVRGFESMAARGTALAAFYSGPVWQEYRGQANVTMFDSDNVLLLHSANATRGFDVRGLQRPARNAPTSRADLVVATIYYFDAEVDPAFVAQFDGDVKPLFERAGARVLAQFVSEKSANNFPRLPVRESDNVFVAFTSFANRAAYDRYLEKLSQDKQWSGELFAVLYRNLKRPPEILMLEPAHRSLIGHH